MKKKAIIGGNHLVSRNELQLELAPLNHGINLLDKDTDLILFFDHSQDISLPELVVGRKNFPLVSVERFKKKNDISVSLPANTFCVFENSLRNYARSQHKKENTKLTPAMYKTACDITSCNCLGITVSLLEILYTKYSYTEIIWVENKLDGRTKVHDLLKTNIVFPELKIVWT